jgi:hypothetical protein
MKSWILLSMLLLGSCASIKSFMKKGEAHQKMADRLDSNTYEMKLITLQEKVIAFFAGDHDSPMIVLPLDQSSGGTLEQQHDRRKAIEDAFADQGFSYKNTMYKDELDVNWMGLWKDHSKEAEKIKAHLKTGSYHVIENTKDMFMIVKGVNVYKGEAMGTDKSKLTILEIKDLKRDPMQVKLAWFQIIKTQKLWFSLSDGPVSLEKSMTSAKRDKLKELSMLYYLDQPKFVAWETEASKAE